MKLGIFGSRTLKDERVIATVFPPRVLREFWGLD